MKHESQTRYPASSSMVLKMFSDLAFHERKLKQLNYKYRVLEHSFDGKTFRIRVERKLPVQLPFGNKTAGETTVIHEEAWHLDSKSGEVSASPQGMPLQLSCQATLKDQGGECVVSYRWDVRAKLPVVGGALEKFAVADLEKRAADEARVALSLLDGYR